MVSFLGGRGQLSAKFTWLHVLSDLNLKSVKELGNGGLGGAVFMAVITFGI